MAATLLILAGMPSPAARAQAMPSPTIPGVADPHLSPAQQARIKVRNTKFPERPGRYSRQHAPDHGAERSQIQDTRAGGQCRRAVRDDARAAGDCQKEPGYCHAHAAGADAARRGIPASTQGRIRCRRALTAKLNKSLTPAQNAQIKAIKLQANVELQQLIASKSMSPQAQAGKAWHDPAGTRKQRLKPLLNPAQKADAAQLDQIKQKLINEQQATRGK